MKVQRVRFYRAQVNTAGDGVDLPVGAVLDGVDHVSQGEYVNLTYHLSEEVEVDDDASAEA